MVIHFPFVTNIVRVMQEKWQTRVMHLMQWLGFQLECINGGWHPPFGKSSWHGHQFPARQFLIIIINGHYFLWCIGCIWCTDNFFWLDCIHPLMHHSSPDINSLVDGFGSHQFTEWSLCDGSQQASIHWFGFFSTHSITIRISLTIFRLDL